eukprot:gene548-1963_t
MSCLRLLNPSTLATALLQTLRFQFGEIYTVVVSPFFGCNAPSNDGDPSGDVSIAFTCDPANRSRLKEMVLEELDENSYWHDILVTAYQSKSYQEVKDVDMVYNRTMDSRTKVFAEAGPESVKEALQRIFPFPCRTRYTALTMVPQPLPLPLRLLVAGLEMGSSIADSVASMSTTSMLAGVVAVGALGAMAMYRSRSS